MQRDPNYCRLSRAAAAGAHRTPPASSTPGFRCRSVNFVGLISTDSQYTHFRQVPEWFRWSWWTLEKITFRYYGHFNTFHVDFTTHQIKSTIKICYGYNSEQNKTIRRIKLKSASLNMYDLFLLLKCFDINYRASLLVEFIFCNNYVYN